MFKTHSTPNKDTVLFISVSIGMVLLFVVHIVILLPLLTSLYKKEIIPNGREAIDAKLVEGAIKIISEPN